MKRIAPKSHAAFTLIEIMLVVVIIVILMVALLPNFRSLFGESKSGIAQIYVSGKLAPQVSLYEMKNGYPPTTQQGLAALVEKPTSEPIPRKWSLLMDRIEPDPWGVPYRYECPGKHNKNGFDVYSCGPDRTPGTDDDIGNWD